MVMEDLTDRQREILEFILKEVQTKGYPPSVREIGEVVGLSSSSSVHAQLEKLEQKGYLRRDPTKPRAIEILDDNYLPSGDLFGLKNLVNIPIVGTVTAGKPILAEQNIQDYFPLPKDFTHEEDLFMLRVKGDSMINAGIFDGDLVIVNKTPTAINGDIIVAMLEDEATVKRFYKEQNQIRLQPENEQYKPIISPNIQVIGKVIGLIRKIH